MNVKKTLTSATTLSGTLMGAGILGIPYVFSQAGFIMGLFWTVFLGLIMVISYLYIGEISLRTKEDHQLPGLAERYLGKKGKILMLSAMIFGIYASLVAYLIGEGESLSILFFGNYNYSLMFTIVFWLVLTILLEGGLDRLKRIETFGVIVIFFIIVIMFFLFFPQMDFGRLNDVNTSNLFLPVGVVLFALFGFTSLPEIRDELRGDEKDFKWAIIIGALIPIILYFIFSITFIAVLGRNVTEIATLSFGSHIALVGVFSMLISYFVLSFSLKDVCIYDLKISRVKGFVIKSVVPFLVFILLYYLKWDNFIDLIGITGVIAAGVIGILVVFMNYKAKRVRGRKPEFTIYINKFIVIVLSMIFVMGALIEIYNILS